MRLRSPVAVTGAQGRLGGALLSVLAQRGIESVRWSRPDYDLDDATAADRLIARDGPGLVIHAAAWTDVDGCARDPALAHRRNATAVAELASACAAALVPLVVVSTNEVFDGERDDGQGYAEEDQVRPINPYGLSKLEGESAARAAYRDAGLRGFLWIVRTAWLYGPPGADFPVKILAAADQLADGAPLRVVSDETGSPTYAWDLAAAIVDLASRAPAGIYHLASPDSASRYEVAQAVIQQCRPARTIEPISRREFARPSNPPAWAVLDSSRAAGLGVTLRPWRTALAEYLDQLC